MRTIPKNWRGLPRDDYRSRCDICGVSWPRSKLTRNQARVLCCYRCIKGRDEVELSQAIMDDGKAYNEAILNTVAKETY